MAKILLIGPKTNKKDPEKTGGVIVLFEQFLADLRKTDIGTIEVDSNMLNYRSRLHGFLSIYKNILLNIMKADHVSLHGTVNGYLFIAPVVLLAAKIFGKTVSLRKFGGSFNEIYENSSRIKRFLIKEILRHADYSFFETKYLVEYFRKWNKKTFWFPNVRKQAIIPSMPRSYSKRFVFISHVRRSKGIDQILGASLLLDPGYVIDIYGPIMDDEYTPDDFKKYKVSYKGSIEHAKVLSTLNKYDVLILPSFGEGYPGIIIEAYSLGIPVIATRLPSVMEICNDGIEGILVDVGNTVQLAEAMRQFNPVNYPLYSRNAYKSFDMFRSETYTEWFIQEVKLNHRTGVTGERD